MFKDELTLIALKNKNKPSVSTNKAVEAFKDALRKSVQNEPDSKEASYPINSGRVVSANPYHKGYVCNIEDLPEIEKVFKKEGISMDWSYDRTHLNGTLTFKW